MTDLSESRVTLRCGTELPLDRITAPRLQAFLDGLPARSIEEAHRLCLSISGAVAGSIELPDQRWVDRFRASLGPALERYELRLRVGSRSPLISPPLPNPIKKRRVRRHG